MSTLFTLFSATIKLYEEYENSRYGTNIPIVGAYLRNNKTAVLTQHLNEIKDPKDDAATAVVIQKLALDTTFVKYSKNLINILEACSRQSVSAAEKQAEINQYREENTALFGTVASHVEYVRTLNEFINNQYQMALQTLKTEFQTLQRDTSTELNDLRQQLATEKLNHHALTIKKKQQDEVVHALGLTIDQEAIKLATEKSNYQTLYATKIQQDEAVQALGLMLEQQANKLTTEVSNHSDLSLKKKQQDEMIQALGLTVEQQADRIEALTEEQADLQQKLNTANYLGEEAVRKLAEVTSSYEEDINHLKQVNQQTANYYNVQIKMHKDSNTKQLEYIADLERKHTALVEELSSDMTTLRAELADAKSALQIASQLNETKAANEAILQKQLQKQTNENMTQAISFTQQYETEKKKIAGLNSQLTAANENVAKLSNECNAATSLSAALQKELQNEKTKNDVLTKSESSLRTQICQLDKSIKQLSKTKHDQNITITDQMSKLEVAKNEVVRLKTVGKDFVKKYKDSLESLATLKSKQASLEGELADLNKKAVTAQDSYAALQTENENLTRTNQLATSELQATVSTLQTRIDQLETQNALAEETRKQLSEQIAKLRNPPKVAEIKTIIPSVTMTPATLFSASKNDANLRLRKQQAATQAVAQNRSVAKP